MGLIALKFIAVIIGAIGLHNYEYGYLATAFIMIMMFFILNDDSKEQNEKNSPGVNVMFWLLTIAGDIIFIIRMVQLYIIK